MQEGTGTPGDCRATAPGPPGRGCRGLPGEAVRPDIPKNLLFHQRPHRIHRHVRVQTRSDRRKREGALGPLRLAVKKRPLLVHAGLPAPRGSPQGGAAPAPLTGVRKYAGPPAASAEKAEPRQGAQGAGEQKDGNVNKKRGSCPRKLAFKRNQADTGCSRYFQGRLSSVAGGEVALELLDSTGIFVILSNSTAPWVTLTWSIEVFHEQSRDDSPAHPKIL